MSDKRATSDPEPDPAPKPTPATEPGADDEATAVLAEEDPADEEDEPDEDPRDSSEADDDEPYLGVGRFDAPPLPPMVGVAVSGLLCGVATVGLVWLSQRGCDATRNTTNCGSMGLPLLLLIVAATIVLGVVMLRRLLVPRAGLVAFLGVCFSLLVVLAVLWRWLFSPWMLLVVPVTSALTFVAARLVVSRL